MKVTQKIGGKGKQPGQQDGSVADDKTDQKESQLNLNLKRYGGILLLQTILVFFLWFFGLERVSVTLYDVNFRVFDVFFHFAYAASYAYRHYIPLQQQPPLP